MEGPGRAPDHSYCPSAIERMLVPAEYFQDQKKLAGFFQLVQSADPDPLSCYLFSALFQLLPAGNCFYL